MVAPPRDRPAAPGYEFCECDHVVPAESTTRDRSRVTCADCLAALAAYADYSHGHLDMTQLTDEDLAALRLSSEREISRRLTTPQTEDR